VNIQGINHLEDWPNTCPKIIEDGIEKGFNVYFESGEFVSEVELKPFPNNKLKVPSERVWKLEFARSEPCRGGCQSLIRLNGEILVDEDRNLTIGGVFTLDSNTDEVSTVWLRPGTEVSFSVVDPPEGVTISEYVE
jgi:hypothetical protein